ncbi:MAG: glycosyl transferase family 2, partial [Clostridia bacterium]|nr:glycosyl transferase family 2 [Clostridia bacterium]
DGHCEWADAEDVKLDHWPDGEKSRAQYLPLLELAVREDPTNDRNMHYLGREYMFRGEYEKAIDTLKRHLELPGALWKDERCASMRFIARCCAALGQGEESERWCMRAAAEAPHLREPWLDWARHAYVQEDWPAVLFCCTRALAIAERPRSYISEPESWGEMPHDLCCIANFRLGRIEAALQQARFAEQLAPQVERIRQNRIVLEEMAGQGVDSGAPDMVP